MEKELRKIFRDFEIEPQKRTWINISKRNIKNLKSGQLLSFISIIFILLPLSSFDQNTCSSIFSKRKSIDHKADKTQNNTTNSVWFEDISSFSKKTNIRKSLDLYVNQKEKSTQVFMPSYPFERLDSIIELESKRVCNFPTHRLQEHKSQLSFQVKNDIIQNDPKIGICGFAIVGLGNSVNSPNSILEFDKIGESRIVQGDIGLRFQLKRNLRVGIGVGFTDQKWLSSTGNPLILVGPNYNSRGEPVNGLVRQINDTLLIDDNEIFNSLQKSQNYAVGDANLYQHSMTSFNIPVNFHLQVHDRPNYNISSSIGLRTQFLNTTKSLVFDDKFNIYRETETRNELAINKVDLELAIEVNYSFKSCDIFIQPTFRKTLINKQENIASTQNVVLNVGTLFNLTSLKSPKKN